MNSDKQNYLTIFWIYSEGALSNSLPVIKRQNYGDDFHLKYYYFTKILIFHECEAQALLQ